MFIPFVLVLHLKVDIHIMTQPPSGEWVYFDTELTNSSGRVSYTIPESKRLGIGVYPVKMVVRYVSELGQFSYNLTWGSVTLANGTPAQLQILGFANSCPYSLPNSLPIARRLACDHFYTILVL